MRCLIVDGESYAVNLLAKYIEQTPFLELGGKCCNAIEAINYLENNEIDVIFLDIKNMPKLSGMQLAGLLKEDYQIIFTTAYSEFAVESYELNAVDYLLKPITFERFIKSVQKARSARQERKAALEKLPDNSDATFFCKKR